MPAKDMVSLCFLMMQGKSLRLILAASEAIQQFAGSSLGKELALAMIQMEGWWQLSHGPILEQTALPGHARH